MEQSWIDVQRGQASAPPKHQARKARPSALQQSLQHQAQEDTTAAQEELPDLESAPSTAASSAASLTVPSPPPALSASGSTDENLRTSFSTLLQAATIHGIASNTTDGTRSRKRPSTRPTSAHECIEEEAQSDTRKVTEPTIHAPDAPRYCATTSDGGGMSPGTEPGDASAAGFVLRHWRKLTIFSLGLLSGLMLSGLVRRLLVLAR